MPKTEIFQDVPLPTSSDAQELWRWLYTELRAAILDGRLKRGARLPSTRSLAQQYGISRGTVITAFDQLQAEGYTHTEVGSGTYVASGLPDRTFVARPANGSAPNLPSSKATLSKRALEALKHIKTLPATHSVAKAFRSYEPAIDLFPVDLWARTYAERMTVLQEAARKHLGGLLDLTPTAAGMRTWRGFRPASLTKRWHIELKCWVWNLPRCRRSPSNTPTNRP